MKTIALLNVTVCDPESSWNGKKADILIKRGKIEKIVKAGKLDEKYDESVKGGHVSPGWVDMRVHLSDPGYEWKEDLDSLAAAAAAGGFTSIVTMPNTHPVIDNGGMLRSLKLRSESLPVRLLPTGALSVGAAGGDIAEMYDMHQGGAVAFTDGIHSTTSTGTVLRGLQYLKPFDGLLMNFPLDESLAGEAQVGEGRPSTLIGMKGIPAVAEEMIVDRDLKLLDYFEHRIHIGPVTTEAAVTKLKAAKKKFPGLSVETSALYLLVNDKEIEGFNVNMKVFPPLRDEKSRKALIKAVAEGTIDVISSSHHPQGIEEKEHDFHQAEYGAEMLETAFAAINTALDGKVELDRMIACLTINPRKILKQSPVSVEEGGAAELTLFDPNVEFEVGRKDIRSKSKNNPLIGRKLKGRPLGIISKGKLHIV